MRTQRFLAAMMLILLLAGCRQKSSPTTQPSADPPPSTLPPGPLSVRVTSYWTADQRFYSGDLRPARDRSGNDIGRFPEDFLKAVRREGWGRISSGPHVGRFIGYEPMARCYSTSDRPLDAQGRPLVPWESVAADPSVPCGSVVRLVQVPANVSPDPVVRDRLAQPMRVCDRGGLVGRGHIDIYVGQQDREDMDKSPAALNFQTQVEVMADH